MVHGDNLLALKALIPYYAGQVKLVFIDPPYNTGNETWMYNDAVNSPEMRDWLGKVGRDGEDLTRHDKWLCMMYPRLALLRDMLREDGAIFISIDDTEVGHLRLICDEIFGPSNFITDVIWHKRVSPANDAKYFSTDIDHILVYARNRERWRPHRLPKSEEQLRYYSNPDNDPRGPWNSAAYTCAKTAEERPNLYYPITNPTTGAEVWPKRTRVWAYERETHEQNVRDALIYWGKSGTARMPRLKVFLKGSKPVVPRALWGPQEAGHNQEAKMELQSLLPGGPNFPTPKPVRLIQRILQVATDASSVIMDSFAGSATTGHAVFALNKSDGGNRRFVLVEMDERIAQDVASVRLRRAIEQVYGGASDAAPSRAGFRFCRLGASLFDEHGQIAASVGYLDLARHLVLAETGEPASDGDFSRRPLICERGDVAYYLLFGGVLGDRGDVLGGSTLAALPPPSSGASTTRVVFGVGCRLSPERLRREKVVFKQIPYELKRC